MGAPRPRSQGPPGPPRHYDSDSDSSSDEDSRKKSLPKPAPKQLLYTGLACVATIAAANNIYQSAKAHHTRQKELDEGEISSAEAQKLKMQARKMDLISLGVAAVGAYNVRNGWRRAEGHVSTLSILVLHLSQPLSSLRKYLSRNRVSMLLTQIFMFENRSQKRNAYSILFSGRHIRNSRLRGGGRVGGRVPKYFGLKVFFSR